MRHSILPIILLLGACSGAPENPPSDRGAETVRLLLWRPEADAAYVLHLAGQRLGFFAQEGLDVRIVSAGHETAQGQRPEPFDAVLMGRARLYRETATTPGLYQVFNFNVQTVETGNDAVVSRAESPASWTELPASPRVAILGGGPGCSPLMRQLVAKHGKGAPALQDFRDRGDEFLAGAWDLAYVREPFLSAYLARGAIRIVEDGPLFAKHVFSPWPMTVTALSSRFAAEFPERAAKLVRAYDRTIDWVRRHPDEAAAILNTYAARHFGVSDLAVRPLRLLRSDELQPELVQRQSAWYFDQGLTSGPIDARRLFYQRPVEATAAVH
jgi:ABC-type nitrate/sulfonate/bicarbonate transport system substrate-binding protein